MIADNMHSYLEDLIDLIPNLDQGEKGRIRISVVSRSSFLVLPIVHQGATFPF